MNHNLNKQIDYSYVLVDLNKNNLYSIRDGQDGWCTSLHAATRFASEEAARSKRDELHEKYNILYEVRRLVIEYTLYEL